MRNPRAHGNGNLRVAAADVTARQSAALRGKVTTSIVDAREKGLLRRFPCFA